MSDKIYLPATITSENGFTRYLQEINHIPSLTQEEEFMLAKAYLEHHDLDAAHKLVTSHLKLVAKIALSYRHYGLPVTELVSEGNLGLMHAVKKYDPDLGNRLSTYAMWWIKASIQEYILRTWSLVKMGTTAAQKKLFFSLSKVKNKIANANSRNVTQDDYAEIAKELEVSEREVAEMDSRMRGGDVSLHNPVGDEDSDSELIDFIAEPRLNQELTIVERESNVLRLKLLSQALGTLGDREKAVLTARRLSYEPETLDSLSNKYGISKERVRQIENRAFEKVQEYITTNIPTMITRQ